MHRTNIPFDMFEMPNPIGTALGLLVAQYISNMSFTKYYKIEHVTVRMEEAGKGLLPYTELSYDGDTLCKERGVGVPGNTNARGMTFVRIYERDIGGWCDIEFLDKDEKIVYQKNSVFPAYSGHMVAMITEYLLGGTVFLDLEPVPMGDDRPEELGSGWFLQEGRPEHVCDTPQEAWEKDNRTPKFFLRLEKAAADMGLLEIAHYFKKTHDKLEILGYPDNKPRPHPGEMTAYIVARVRQGVRKWTEDEIKGVAINQAMEAGLITSAALTPAQMRYYTIYLQQRAYHFDAVRNEQAMAKKD